MEGGRKGDMPQWMKEKEGEMKGGTEKGEDGRGMEGGRNTGGTNGRIGGGTKEG